MPDGSGRRPLRLAQINSHSDINGVVTNCVDLYACLAERGHRITLLHRPEAWIARQRFPPGVALVPMEMGRRLPPRVEIARIRQLLRARGVDLIHAHGSMANTVAAMLRLAGTAPAIATAHARIANLNYLFLDGMIALNPAAAAHFRRTNLIDPQRIKVLHNVFRPAEVELFRSDRARQAARAELRLPAGAFVLGVVGHLGRRKNQSLAVQLMAAAVRRGVDAHCVLIGAQDGDETGRVRDVMHNSSLHDRVHMTGLRTDARRLIAAFDVLVCSSRDEQCPIAVLEGMALDKPIIATDVGCLRDMVDPGHSGVFFSEQDIGPATALVEQLAASPALRSAFGQRSRHILEERFTPEVVIPEIEAVYHSTIGRRATARLQA
ncbi:MAG: glycosyltransferase [Rhodobacteraceae bacterium]|nr:glycosyltransferase [Paracoccaceae bacterium]